jgi:DedD protein
MAVERESRAASRETEGSDPMAEYKRRSRWRLLGSIILVGAVAMAAPLFLEEQAKTLSDDLLIEIQSRPAVQVAAAPAEPAVPAVPVVPPPEPKPETKAEPAAESKPPAPSPTAPKTTSKPVTAPKPVTASTPSSAYFVQVGAYAKLESAQTVKKRLEAGGHRVLMQTIKTADGNERHRVRIGPVETKDQAVELRDRAKAQGYDAVVVNP